MTIKKTEEGKNITLAIEGRIDTTTAPDFEKEINAIDSFDKLVLDFSKVEYISSAGLRVVLKAQKAANAQKSNMILTGVNDDVMDVFDITGFLDILTIK